MKLIKSKEGFTLVEILISLVILGIIIGSFVGLFSLGFTNIFSIGNKDLATAEASAFMDLLYKEQEISGLTEQKIRDLLDDFDSSYDIFIEEIESINFDDTSGNLDIKPGYNVTIGVNYRGENRQVFITSFIRGSGGNE